MKTNFTKKIVTTLTSFANTLLQTGKMTEAANREYATKGRFYYFPEF